jgi:hypothetical protein
MNIRQITAVAALATAVSIGVVSEGEAGGGTPVTTCGQVVTTNAFLAQDLYCPGSAGIVVGSSRITIDLRGLTLRGNNSASYGIDDFAGYDAVTIKNGVVRNFNQGVDAENGADDIRISGLLASGNANDGIRIFGDSAKINSSTSSGNAVTGIVVMGGGLSVTSASVSGNGYYGMYVVGSPTKIQSSTASGNGSYGIFVGGAALVVKGNRADANGFAAGASDLSGLGIWAWGYATPPVGTNVVRGNDDPAECDPAALC